MFQIVLILIAWCTPEPASVRGLAAPRFAERQCAEQRLRVGLTYAQAVRLALRPPASPEARRRAETVLRDYWRMAPGRWPYIDALNPKWCEPPDTPAVSRHLDWARSQPIECWPSGQFGEYRLATASLVGELQNALAPPALIRGLLAEMTRRSDAWEAARRQRMPAGPEPVPTTVRHVDGIMTQELLPRK